MISSDWIFSCFLLSVNPRDRSKQYGVNSVLLRRKLLGVPASQRRRFTSDARTVPGLLSPAVTGPQLTPSVSAYRLYTGCSLAVPSCDHPPCLWPRCLRADRQTAMAFLRVLGV
ncbi:hypothetical protein CHARACLAT_030484 [Characodon lateralis]|uniref:Uncharacterized protein n=1 Tax=Characodon lateralis TaxID=208331 RepID=A0ABU7ENX8_9TELE|nr:hypothetical protein [Characodon lateralis]